MAKKASGPSGRQSVKGKRAVPPKTVPLRLNPDRLFPPNPTVRAIARRLHKEVRDLPILSPHGHTDPAWFAENEPFPDPAALFIVPDHYIFRMLYSQGIPLESLGIPRRIGGPAEHDPRKIWRLFAENYHLFRATPSRFWFEHALAEVFGVKKRLAPASADEIYDRIAACLKKPQFRPRALYERFKIEVIATTESPLDPLAHHRKLRQSNWRGRVLTAYRPDPVVDPEFDGFAANVRKLGEITNRDTSKWQGYLDALMDRRRFFAETGATSTDHGHPSARTADLSRGEAELLFG